MSTPEQEKEWYRKWCKNKRRLHPEYFENRNKKKRVKNKLWQREYRKRNRRKILEYNRYYHKTKRDQRKELAKLKERFVKFKERLHCESCGLNHVAVLDFHHRDPKKKKFTISQMTISRPDFIREVEKCSVLCSNCHRIHHYEERKRI